LNDVFAASQVGFRTALFAGDARSLRRRDQDPRCAGATPDVILTELTQLLQCVRP
jgi:putative hydrolase of the HAD superfamily